MASTLQSILEKWRSLTGRQARQALADNTFMADAGGVASPPAKSRADGGSNRSANGQASSMVSLWQQYEAWLSAHFPEGLEGLTPGASLQQLRELQSALGVDLSPAFQAWASVHNGQVQGSVGLLDGNELLSSDDMLEQWAGMNKLLDQGLLPASGESDPPGATAPVWWSKRWIPIASDGSGNLVCIDMAPGPTGTMGQIIDFDHETVHRTVLAPSFEAYVRGFVNDVQAGDYGYSEDYGRLMPLRDF